MGWQGRVTGGSEAEGLPFYTGSVGSEWMEHSQREEEQLSLTDTIGA